MANKLKNVIIISIFTILLILLLIPKNLNKEGFSILNNNYSAEYLYSTNSLANFENQLNDQSFINNNTQTEFIYKRCYQYPEILENLMATNQNYYQDDKSTQIFTVVTPEYNDVRIAIVNAIQTAHDTLLNDGTGVAIHGPVYILMTQVPYYKNIDGSTMAIQHNIDNYLYTPVYVVHDTNTTIVDTNVTETTRGLTVQKDTQPIFYYIEIHYSRYDKKGRLMKIDSYFENVIKNTDNINLSYEQQCYIRGAGTSGTNVFGGCASTQNTISGITSDIPGTNNNSTNTDAKCLGPKPENHLSPSSAIDYKNTVSTFISIYMVNTKCSTLKQYFYDDSTNVNDNKWIFLSDTDPDVTIPQTPMRILNNKVQCLSSDGVNCLTSFPVSELQTINNPDIQFPYIPYNCSSTFETNAWCASAKNALTDALISTSSSYSS